MFQSVASIVIAVVLAGCLIWTWLQKRSLENKLTSLQERNDPVESLAAGNRTSSEALKASEERYRELFQNIRSGVAVYEAADDGADFIFKDFNAAGERMESIEIETLLGKKVTDVFPGVKKMGLFEVFHRVWKTGRPEHHPITIYKDDRIAGWRENYVYKLSSGEIVAVYDDVTEQKQTEEALRNSEKKYRMFIQNLEGIAYQVGISDFELHFMHGVVEKITGYTVEEFMNKSVAWDQLIHPDDREAVEQEMEKLRSIPEYPAHLEYRIIRKDDRIRWVRDIGNCVRDDNGDPLFFQGAVYDVTEQKEAEEQAMLQRQQLMEADKMISLGNLVSGVSHEINNPNHIIMSHVYPLMEAWKQAEPVLTRYHKEVGDLSLAGIPFEEAKKEIPEMFIAVLDGSTRIKTIVKELRDYARERPAEPPSPVQINQVVKSAITLLTNMLKKYTDRFSVEYGKEMPDVLGNYQRLEQVVIHLVRNACQALDHKEKGIKVTTASEKKKRVVMLTVEDEGVGIASEAMEHITDPFYTTKRETGDSGLGLSTSSSIILEHRGTLTFASTPGKGTSAKVTLPAMDAAEGGE